jgi:hypothetical protein
VTVRCSTLTCVGQHRENRVITLERARLSREEPTLLIGCKHSVASR